MRRLELSALFIELLLWLLITFCLNLILRLFSSPSLRSGNCL